MDKESVNERIQQKRPSLFVIVNWNLELSTFLLLLLLVIEEATYFLNYFKMKMTIGPTDLPQLVY